MKHITSTDNPFYKELSKLSSAARHRTKAGQTLLDGAHLLAACVASGLQPLHLIINEKAKLDTEISSLIKSLPHVPITQIDDVLFAKLSELKSVSGLLALIGIPQNNINAGNSQFCLLLENIQDPGNMGSMLRSAAAAGCDAVYMSSGCADAWSPKVLRAAMGGHFILNLFENADLPAVAKAFSGTIYATSLQADYSIYSSGLSGRVGFAIGNEGAGLSGELLGVCKPVTIPMPGKVESLNAAAAAAICLFEAVRQRHVPIK